MKKLISLLLIVFAFQLSTAQVSVLTGKNGGTGIANTSNTLLFGDSIKSTGTYYHAIRFAASNTRHWLTSTTGTLVTTADVWLPNGNSFGSVKYLGTNDAYDFPFRSNNVERFRLTSAGDFKFSSTTNVTDGTGVTVFSPLNRTYYDALGNISADLNNYSLKTIGSLRVNWDATQLSIGSTLSMDWGANKLFFPNQKTAVFYGASPYLNGVWDIDSTILAAGKISIGNGSNIAIAVTPSLSGSAGTFSLATTGAFTFPNADGSTRGLLLAVDWTTFNNKQAALTNPITGTGSSGQVAFFTGSTSQIGDASFIWDNTNKRLGVGATSPVSALHIIETSTATPRGINSDQYSTNTSGSRITMRKARGTFASPSTIVTGDALGSWTAAGYEGTSFIEAAKILVTSAGTIGTNTVPATMAFLTSTATGSLTTAFTIDQAQAVSFNGVISATSPLFTTPNCGVPSFITLTNGTGLPLTTGVTGVLPVANGGTNASSASITAFNNITGYSASGATGTTSTNLVFSTSATLITPTLGVASSTSESITGTGGNGFLQIANQSSAPGTPTTSGRLYFDNSNRLSWKGTNGYVRTFDGTSNTADRVYVLPDVAGTVVLDVSTVTLTNKRITSRVSTTTSSATVTPNADTDDEYTITAQAAALTLASPSGTPTEGQKLIIRIKDNATARAITFNSIYRFSSSLAAPTTTTISKTMYLGFIYNNTDSKWDCIAYLDNF